MEAACGVTSELIGIEHCDIERRRLRSDADSGGPAIGLVLLPWGPERVEEGARDKSAEVREENVPVLCAFEGAGVGVGPERRACLLWSDDSAREDVCEDVCSRREATARSALEGS
jgi:hypothetical protein